MYRMAVLAMCTSDTKLDVSKSVSLQLHWLISNSRCSKDVLWCASYMTSLKHKVCLACLLRLTLLTKDILCTWYSLFSWRHHSERRHIQGNKSPTRGRGNAQLCAWYVTQFACCSEDRSLVACGSPLCTRILAFDMKITKEYEEGKTPEASFVKGEIKTYHFSMMELTHQPHRPRSSRNGDPRYSKNLIPAFFTHLTSARIREAP